MFGFKKKKKEINVDEVFSSYSNLCGAVWIDIDFIVGEIERDSKIYSGKQYLSQLVRKVGIVNKKVSGNSALLKALVSLNTEIDRGSIKDVDKMISILTKIKSYCSGVVSKAGSQKSQEA